MASSNPAMNVEVYRRAGYADEQSSAMTLQGTVLKTAILVAILMFTGTITWTQISMGANNLAYGLTIAGLIGGGILCLVTCFVPRFSPVTAPLYAAAEGLFLGAISRVFETMYSGIAVQAAALTVGVLSVMLVLYGTRIIHVTQKFRIGVIAATGAIALVYLVSFITSFFNGGGGLPYIHQSGPIGIGFSLVVVGIAALNLILDFDFIEQGVQHQAPKFMEWYGGFSLLVTLVWMYLEILRLLAKLRDNR